MAKAMELNADAMATAPPVPKAAKLAAIQLDFSTVSEFMPSCCHAYMKTVKTP